MNEDRRKEIAALNERIDNLKTSLEEIKDEIENGPKTDEEAYYYNMPESLQGGEKGETAQTAIDALNDAVEQLGDAVDALDSATGRLNDAC